MKNRCSVPNCNSLRQDVKFHVFPSVNLIRLNKWLDCINSDSLRALSVAELGKRYICHKHFEKRFVTSRSRLLGNAYPTLFTDDEIASGIPSLHLEDSENIMLPDHNYARKRHHDHSYAKAPLGICQQLANIPDVTPSVSVMPLGEMVPTKVTDHPSSFAGVPPLNNSVMPSTSKHCMETQNDTVEVLATVQTQSDTIATDHTGTDIVPMAIPIEPRMSVTIATDPTGTDIVPMAIEPRMSVTRDTRIRQRRSRLVHKTSQLSPKCRRLYEEFRKSKKQLNFVSRAKRALKFSKTQSFEELTKNMEEYAKKLFWMQIKMSLKKKKARRFTLEEKIISLSILKQSPRCYKFLQKIFILPSRTTLKKLVSQLNIETGANPQIFELIKQEVQSWKEEKKYCSVIFDEMALETGLTYNSHKDKATGFVELNERKPQFADHALVFMAKGALYKWQQPLGFYFCEGATSGVELKIILKKIVKAIGDSGLIPVALVSDQGSAFQSALKSLQEETRRSQILNNENNANVIALQGFELNVIYDPPHLIKGLRNNFLTKDILFEDKLAKWSDIVDVYKADCRHAETRLLHKLNDEHIIPEKIKKMKVKNCVRVFSKTMAGALAYTSQFSHYTDGTPVSETLLNTSNVIRFLDNLFDSVNGASLQPKRGKGKDLRKAVTDNSQHHTFWKEAIVKLKKMKFVDKNNKRVTVPSISNWITTLESFMRLWQFFKNKNIKIMRPRYFNSDSIENFFGQVRAYNFRSNNPNCNSFINTFKSLLITGFIKFHSESYNCEEDSFRQLLKINELFSYNFHQPDILCQNNIASLNVSDVVQNSIVEARQERLNIHSRAYTAGWVIRKILKINNCVECTKKLTVGKNTEIHDWITHREYKLMSKRNLIYPSECAVRSFGAILKETNNFLELNAHKLHISKEIKDNIKLNLNFNNLSCELHQNTIPELFLDITVKLGIHNWCNIINKILRGTDIIRLKRSGLPPMQAKALLKYEKKLKRNK